jgi:hypothetical protein
LNDGSTTHLRPERELGQSQWLSSRQAYEATYRFVAHYYDYERLVPILRLLAAISVTTDDPGSNNDSWRLWQACVQETLDAEPLPALAPPWDSR